MCFSQKYSAIFAILGIISLYVLKKYPNKGHNLLYIPVIFYTVMEILQTIQYSYVNNCNTTNRILTEISYVLVIVQPVMWNLVFLFKDRKNPLNSFHKGILYCGIILCGVWMSAHIMRRFKVFSEYNPSTTKKNTNEIATGSQTCTFKERNEHLYWNYEMFSNPGMDANWFMYLALWFIPGLLIPGEKLTIITLLLGFLASYAYVKYNNHNKHITPSLWCLSSGPTLTLNVLLFVLLGL